MTAAWNAVLSWWESRVPPATLLGVAGLGHRGQLVEIDATVRPPIFEFVTRRRQLSNAVVV